MFPSSLKELFADDCFLFPSNSSSIMFANLCVGGALQGLKLVGGRAILGRSRFQVRSLSDEVGIICLTNYVFKMLCKD